MFKIEYCDPIYVPKVQRYSSALHAQEEERARIARELHDNLSQRMALLNVGLGQLEQITRLSDEFRQGLHDIAEISEEVSSILHNLSHQLHA